MALLSSLLRDPQMDELAARADAAAFARFEFDALLDHLEQQGARFHPCEDLGETPQPLGVSFRYDLHQRDIAGAYVFLEAHRRRNIPATFFLLWDYTDHELGHLEEYKEFARFLQGPARIGLHDSPGDVYLLQHFAGGNRAQYNRWLASPDALAWFTATATDPEARAAFERDILAHFTRRVARTRELFGPCRTMSAHGGELHRAYRARLPDLDPAVAAFVRSLFAEQFGTPERLSAAGLVADVERYKHTAPGWHQVSDGAGNITRMMEEAFAHGDAKTARQFLIHPFTWHGGTRDTEITSMLGIANPFRRTAKPEPVVATLPSQPASAAAASAGDRLHAIIAGKLGEPAALAENLHHALGHSIDWTTRFLRQTRAAVFSYEPGACQSLYYPLQRRAYHSLFIHGSTELFASGTALDFLSRAMNALAPDGTLYIDPAVFSGDNRLSRAMVETLLGAPAMQSSYLTYPARDARLPEDRSMLGWWYDQRGTIVETNVTGGGIHGKNPHYARAVFGDFLYPGDLPQTLLTRLPRETIETIVNRVRSGDLPRGSLADVPPQEGVAYSWNWETHGKKFQSLQESWENYLIPSNIAKAASIGAVLQRAFPGRRDLSFLEHGGNAGLVTAQLLLDERIATGVCCEIDIVPLLNGLNLYHHYHDRLHGRMHVRTQSADAATYERRYSMIAFIHMLLYIRRDLLPQVLQQAWDALEPGGILLSHENTTPPTTSGGVDGPIIFTPEELESYLAPFGEIHYAHHSSGQPVDRSEGQRIPLIRYVKKPA